MNYTNVIHSIHIENLNKSSSTSEVTVKCRHSRKFTSHKFSRMYQTLSGNKYTFKFASLFAKFSETRQPREFQENKARSDFKLNLSVSLFSILHCLSKNCVLRVYCHLFVWHLKYETSCKFENPNDKTQHIINKLIIIKRESFSLAFTKK